MPRRPIRCKYFTDSGEPKPNGCWKGTGCSFIHPDNPAWADAEISLFKPMNKDSDSSTSRPWGDGNRRGTTVSSGWDTGSNAATSGGWGSSGGWDTGGGWGNSAATAPEPAQRKNSSAVDSWGASTTDGNQADATRTANGSTKDGGSKDKATSSSWGNGGNDAWGGSSWGGSSDGAGNEAWGGGASWGSKKDNGGDAGSGWGSASGGGWGNTDTNKDTGTGWGGTSAGASGGSWGDKDTNKDAESRRGSGGGAGGNKMNADKAAGSGWGSTASDGWGSGQGNDKDANMDTGSGWGTAWGGGNNDPNKTAGPGWGAGRGDKKDTDKAAGSGWGSTTGEGWGTGEGGSKDATSSWGTSDPMETEPKRDKGKGKAVPAPPRIRIPDNENKRHKITGTNDEPLGSGKQWGHSRSSNPVTVSTPVTASTPVTITPIDSTRVKRKRDVAFDDKLDIFKEYIKAWERGVRARFLLAEAEVKRDRWFRTQKSACFTRIGDAGRKILDDQRAECDEQVNIQREKVSAAITSLVDFHDKIASNVDLGQCYDLGEEMKKFLIDSKAYVDEVRALIVMHVLKEKDVVQPSDNQEFPSRVIATLIDTVQTQVRDFGERFEQSQTELTLRHRRDVHSEINEVLQAKIAESRAARQREVDRAASLPRPEIVIPPGDVKDQEAMVQRLRELDAKVPQAVEDIRTLLLRVDATTKRVIDLEQEVSANRETYEKQKRKLAAERMATEQKIDGELGVLKGKFTELVASQSPTQPPAHNLAERLLDKLLPTFNAVLNEFYEREVLPTIECTQRSALEESSRYQEDGLRVLWGQIQPAMNMVAGVSRWLDSQELKQTAPVEGDQGTSTNL